MVMVDRFQIRLRSHSERAIRMPLETPQSTSAGFRAAEGVQAPRPPEYTSPRGPVR